jgi:hypothetical protein
MNKRLRLLLALLIIISALVTMAPGTPPPEPADCSPGFWKNHTEIWDDALYPNPGDYYGGGMTYLDALQGGKDTKVSRFDVSDLLNSQYPDTNCK